MPENEFELYLSLLGRFLRLKPAQRGEIADELRDHLEARLEELSSQGLSREEAIRAALDEFGDAAELATHFTKIARTRRRRLIMRCTAGTIAALGAVILMSWAFAPGNSPVKMPQTVVAQAIGGGAGFGSGEAGAGTGGAPVKTPGVRSSVTADKDRAAVEAKLAKRFKPDFLDLPLEEALQFIATEAEFDFLINRPAITEAGLAFDTPVTLKVKYVEMTARTALDLILEPNRLSYTIRDGLVVITTSDQASEIQVYNCSDLIAAQAGGGVAMSGAFAPGSTAMGGAMPGGAAGMAGTGPGSMGMSGEGMMGGMGGGFGVTSTQAGTLAEVIMTTIDPNSWQIVGGTGSITEYNGLLVVKGSQTVHIKVRQLLDMMRVATQMGSPTSAVATQAGMAPAGGGRGR